MSLKLYIDMIPQSSWYSNARTILKPTEWINQPLPKGSGFFPTKQKQYSIAKGFLARFKPISILSK